LFVDELEECVHTHTDNYGNKRVQNTYFQYVWPRVPDGVTRFTFTIKGRYDAYLALSSSDSPTNDVKGKDGTPKIGNK
jgi:hypothetical protein